MSSSELYSQFYDENRMITDRGKDFYDQMLNQLGVTEGSDYSFHKYLAEKNPELYDWSISPNMYDYTEAGTNLGTFKTLMGLESTDNEYRYIERYGGLSKEQVHTQVSKIGNYINELRSKSTSGDVRSIINDLETISTDLKTYVNNLQLTSEEKQEILTRIEQFETMLENSKYNVKSTSNWTTLAETAQAWRDGWGRVSSAWSNGNLLEAGANIGMTLAESAGAFLGGLLQDTAETVTNYAGSILNDITLSDVSKLRGGQQLPGGTNRHNVAQKSNEKLARDIEQKYLDLLAYLASASTKNQ